MGVTFTEIFKGYSNAKLIKPLAWRCRGFELHVRENADVIRKLQSTGLWLLDQCFISKIFLENTNKKTLSFLIFFIKFN
jgi:hypothetical protein